MGLWTPRADIVGDLFKRLTCKFEVAEGSDASVHVLNRRATVALPSKAASSGALLQSSRESDALARHNLG